MSVPGEFTAGDVLAAAEMNALPGGVIGYAQITSDQTTITSEADITGLSVTVDVVASRYIRLSFIGRTQGTSADNEIAVRIKEGTTLLASFPKVHDLAGRSQGLLAQRVLTPSSGSHTYKITGQLATGTGSVGVVASADSPAAIIVEDIGPA